MCGSDTRESSRIDELFTKMVKERLGLTSQDSGEMSLVRNGSRLITASFVVYGDLDRNGLEKTPVHEVAKACREVYNAAFGSRWGEAVSVSSKAGPKEKVVLKGRSNRSPFLVSIDLKLAAACRFVNNNAG